MKSCAATAKHPKFQCRYTELVYAPMVEAMNCLYANGYHLGYSNGAVKT